MTTAAATRVKATTAAQPGPVFARSAPRQLQRKCACGGTPSPTGECEACRRKKLQRYVNTRPALAAIKEQPSAAFTVPPVVNDVLSSPGRPLDKATRGFFEPRFGHDFSNVRVHTDRPAAQSAQSITALAYTAGAHVVFGARDASRRQPTPVGG